MMTREDSWTQHGKRPTYPWGSMVVTLLTYLLYIIGFVVFKVEINAIVASNENYPNFS